MPVHSGTSCIFLTKHSTYDKLHCYTVYNWIGIFIFIIFVAIVGKTFSAEKSFSSYLHFRGNKIRPDAKKCKNLKINVSGSSKR